MPDAQNKCKIINNQEIVPPPVDQKNYCAICRKKKNKLVEVKDKNCKMAIVAVFQSEYVWTEDYVYKFDVTS